MSRIQLNKSKVHNTDSMILLHKGVRRSVSKNEYIKIFKKFKIVGKLGNNNMIEGSQHGSFGNIETQIKSLKQKIKEIKIENTDMRGNINKEYKLEDIIDKKLMNMRQYEMNYERAVQIKLLIQTQNLQSKLNQKYEEYHNIISQLRIKQKNMNDSNKDKQIQLYSILQTERQKVKQISQRRQRQIDSLMVRLLKIKEKILIINQSKKIRMQQLNQLQRQVEKAKLTLPDRNQIHDQNDSGIFGTQVRAKTTQSLQKQISRLKQQNNNMQHLIQILIQQKVRQKLLIMKDIDEIQNLIIQYNNNKIIK